MVPHDAFDIDLSRRRRGYETIHDLNEHPMLLNYAWRNLVHGE